MERSDAERLIRALEGFAATGLGDVKALKGALKGRYRLRGQVAYLFQPRSTR
jgi:hypothetical protein